VTAPATLRSLWSTRLAGGAGDGFQPTIVQGRVWVASERGELLCVELETGRIIARTELGKAIATGVAADARTVVVGTRDGELVALDDQGQPRWRAPVGSEIVTVPALGEGVVVVRAADNRVWAWDAGDGQRRWTFQRQMPTLVLRQTGTAAVGSDAILMGLPGGRLVSLSARTGALRWEAAVSNPRGSNEIERIADVVGAPVIAGRDVCAASFNGRLGCFDLTSGRALWARDLSASQAPATDGTLVVAVDTQGVIQAFSRSGASLWKNEAFRYRRLSAPAILPSAVVFGDETGQLHVLSRDDGQVLARYPTDGSPVRTMPQVEGRVVVVQTQAGGVFAFAQN
jgi:outer membrane protein assembly factor BamB